MAGMFAAVFSAALLATAPAPDTPIPREPAALAAALATTSTELRQAIGRWRPKTEKAPKEAVLYALYQQRIYRLLSREDKLADATLPKLPFELRKTARDFLTAHRGLYRLTPPLPTREIKVGAPRPAGELLGYYREAQRRFRVSWNVLAAVNFVESKFGKLRSTSAAGAQGPMQFLPATWRAYGLGGDVHDAHDAILGAANYLRASGAPGNLRLALHHYNPSRAYVDAVLRYARQMHRHYYELYCWQVFVKTPRGDRRVTGP
jgi:membrane-bound lytic murein transglycosylase B